MAPDSDLILTIGHSTHTYERFRELLLGAGATAVADVRTVPRSRFAPQFNTDALADKLRADGIAYAFLGAELGGRPSDRRHYRDGVADFELMAASDDFKRGIARVLGGARRYRIALMCAEQDPLDCHRCLLVARALEASGTRIGHILPDGRIVPHAEIEAVLLARSGRAQADLLASREERLAAAYRERARKIAYAGMAPEGEK